MKNFIHLIFTFLVSTLAFFGALANRNNPWPCFGIAFGVWALLFWRYQVRTKRAALKKRFEEHQYREYLRWKAYRQSRFD